MRCGAAAIAHGGHTREAISIPPEPSETFVALGPDLFVSLDGRIVRSRSRRRSSRPTRIPSSVGLGLTPIGPLTGGQPSHPPEAWDNIKTATELAEHVKELAEHGLKLSAASQASWERSIVNTRSQKPQGRRGSTLAATSPPSTSRGCRGSGQTRFSALSWSWDINRWLEALAVPDHGYARNRNSLLDRTVIQPYGCISAARPS